MTNKNKTNSVYRVLFEYVAILMVIVVPLSVHAGLFAEDATNSPIMEPAIESVASSSPLEIDLLSASQNPEPLPEAKGGAELIVEDGALVSSGPVGEDLIASSRVSTGEISIYTVRAGDTLSHIADMYGVTANTILWANDLPRATSIREGQTLVILPIAGVRHTVKRGDTLSSIAKKYEGDVDEILSYNQLDSTADLVTGMTVVVPGGSMHSAPVVATVSPTKTSGGSSAQSAGFTHPAPGSVKTQGIHGYNAVDLAGAVGSSIRAAAKGEVIVSKSSGWNGGYGQYIVIKHSNGTQTLYAHLSSNGVGVGEIVGQGQVIGSMGNSGRSTGSHLHFEVRGAKNPF